MWPQARDAPTLVERSSPLSPRPLSPLSREIRAKTASYATLPNGRRATSASTCRTSLSSGLAEGGVAHSLQLQQPASYVGAVGHERTRSAGRLPSAPPQWTDHTVRLAARDSHSTILQRRSPSIHRSPDHGYRSPVPRQSMAKSYSAHGVLLRKTPAVARSNGLRRLAASLLPPTEASERAQFAYEKAARQLLFY